MTLIVRHLETALQKQETKSPPSKGRIFERHDPDGEVLHHHPVALSGHEHRLVDQALNERSAAPSPAFQKAQEMRHLEPEPPHLVPPAEHGPQGDGPVSVRPALL